MFIKYPHLERFGTSAVDGITQGKCYLFPKLDGTNASFWYDSSTEQIRCASRNRELNVHEDNAGFMNWLLEQDSLISAAKHFKDYRFYGEWLVPHTLKAYNDDAWRDFYLFDVLTPRNEFLEYDIYHSRLNGAMQIIPCIKTIEKPTYEQL